MKIEWITIPEGFFLMGTNSKETTLLTKQFPTTNFTHEFPQQTVYLSEFKISRYPITNKQYAQFIADTGYTRGVSPYLYDYMYREETTLANHPVCWVSWHDAMVFCQWAGCRLPTEAEWEKAARGTQGFTYPWGNMWKETLCNSLEAQNPLTTVVGSYPQGASPFGVDDMAGNVWEWTNGWITTNSISSPAVTQDAEESLLDYSQHLPVLRGGSKGANKISTRCSYRFAKFQLHERGDWVGFRCVKLEQ